MIPHRITALFIAWALPVSSQAQLPHEASPPPEIRIDADFPGGNITVGSIKGDTVTLQQDLRDTKEWWFYWYFRVQGAQGRTLTFDFTNGEPIAARGPAVSLDEGITWKWLGKQPTNKSFTYTFPPTATSVRFSFGMPYTGANLTNFLSRVGPHPALKREVLCQSRKNRPVERLHLGKLVGEPRFRALISARSHSCEMMASYAVEGVIEAVLADDPLGAWFRENVELLVIPFIDKDGVEDGDQGKHRQPHDHNRDYDEPGLYPETRAIRNFVPGWSAGKLRASFDLHCPSLRGDANEVIFLVGSSIPAIQAEQDRFGKILEEVHQGPLPYRKSDNFPFGKGWNTAAGAAGGTSGSRWAAGLPGIRLATTIEIPYATASKREVTAESARAFGPDLLRAIRRYLEETNGL